MKTKALISCNHEADLRLCFRICKNPVFSRRGSKDVPVSAIAVSICDVLKPISNSGVKIGGRTGGEGDLGILLLYCLVLAECPAAWLAPDGPAAMYWGGGGVLRAGGLMGTLAMSREDREVGAISERPLPPG